MSEAGIIKIVEMVCLTIVGVVATVVTYYFAKLR